ncbi:MAG: Rrf2 family transcriptional regulator [Bryobacterales bacterium]|nr:Rrf2 family transcriptional regulator [Bryobacterales bacterium]
MGPFNISVKGEYALLAILDLAMQRPGEPIKIAGIAKRQRIPQKFLELILSALKQGGFVESRRGADGGYLLARPADAITVGEVLRYMEGGRSRKSPTPKGPPGAPTPFGALWTEVETVVTGILDRNSFAELARSWQDRQARYIPNWDI